jgi:hypothetical protein
MRFEHPGQVALHRGQHHHERDILDEREYHASSLSRHLTPIKRHA